MTDHTLPAPLVPAEVDLRGLSYMPLLGGRLYGSSFDLEASDTEFRRAMILWWAAWNQHPAASIPNSERSQAKLCGFEDEKSPTWRKVKARVLHGFTLCSDGRLYHPVLAEQALIAWERRVDDQDKRQNDKDRKERERAERKRLFATLRAIDITPPWNIGMAELRELVTEPVTPPVTRTGHVTSPEPVTRKGTAKTGRDGTRRDGIEEDVGNPGPTPPPEGSALPGLDPPPPEPPPPPPAEAQPTAYGAITRQLRQAGIGRANPGEVRFRNLVDAGATAEEFLAYVGRSEGKEDPFSWIVGAVEGERKRAAQTAKTLHRGPMPQAAPTRKDRQLETAALMTGARRPAEPPQPDVETIDVPSRILPA